MRQKRRNRLFTLRADLALGCATHWGDNSIHWRLTMCTTFWPILVTLAHTMLITEGEALCFFLSWLLFTFDSYLYCWIDMELAVYSIGTEPPDHFQCSADGHCSILIYITDFIFSFYAVLVLPDGCLSISQVILFWLCSLLSLIPLTCW